MGFLSGGTADKLGNRYEGRWVVKQLLLLIAERILSVEIEAVGNTEVGVDLWVKRLDGVREAHQCKAFNASQSAWTIANLKHRKVLEKACTQLSQDDSVEFKFVSAIVAAELEDLSRNARDSQGDAEMFFQHFVEKQPREKPFKSFCRAVNLDATAIEDRETAFNLLRRIECHPFADDRSTRDELEFMASMLFGTKSPSAVIAALAEIAVNNLHKVLTAPEIVRQLQRYLLQPVAHAADPLTVTRLEALRLDFIDSIKPRLAAGELIERPETQEIRKLLDGNMRQDAIILHGKPGFGKSGILYELAHALKDEGVIFVAVRLDRQSPTNSLSSLTYGQELGLPTSPVSCLRDISAGQSAVLIIDQLDALRWTNAHAAHGLNICKQMLREVQAARTFGAKIEIIFACRSFDLDRDPEIQSWLNGDNKHLKIVKIEAKPLPPSVVRKLVHEKGAVPPDSLRPTQLKLLESVHHLAIWMEIVRSEKSSPQFDSSTQLLRRFWMNRRQKLEEAGCDPVRRDTVISALAKFMEEHACLSAPERLLTYDEKLKTELQTLGVISVLSGEVSFGHQSNLDFLVADGAVNRMTTEKITVLDWLGPIDRQSLFRREQLRQVLFLLADEMHEQFLRTVEILLEASAVRFHIRQLTLEAIGQVIPKPETVDLVLQLLKDPKWSEHIRYHVIHGNREYISALAKRGILQTEIVSNDASSWQQTSDWMWSVRRQLPELVASVCDQIPPSTTDWISRINRTIGHDGMEIETSELFKLRLRCLKNGSEPVHVVWPDLAKKSPARALRLYASLITNWVVRGANQDRHRNESNIYGRDSACLAAVAKYFPELAWKLLWPKLQWFISERLKRKRSWLSANKGLRHVPRREQLAVPSTLRLTLLNAAKILVQRDPDHFLMLANKRILKRSRYLNSFFCELLSHMPIERSESAIDWLLGDFRRLACSRGARRTRWSMAVNLIRRMSPHCTIGRYQDLEAILLKFRDPREKRMAKFWLAEVRHGSFRNQFGVAQHHLLPALSPNRRSTEVVGRIGVLREKFSKFPKEVFFTRQRLQGGWVSSPIDSDQRYVRMSDKSWLKLILNRRVPTKRGEWRFKDGKNGGIVEASVETMSRSFGRAAKRDPERFARLALNFPATVSPDYFSEAMAAACESNPPQEVPEDQRDAWKPATSSSVDDLLAGIPDSDNWRFALQFCSVVTQRSDIKITDSILEKLQDYSEHNDPEPDQLNYDCNKRASDCSTKTLTQNACSSVRGSAAIALASILWDRFELLPKLQPTIVKLLQDPHPAVRVAATRFCTAIWRHNPNLAIDWLQTATKDDVRVAATHEVSRLFNFGFPEHEKRLADLILEMAKSYNEEVAEAGARQVAARWILYDLFETELLEFCRGSGSHRKGVANAFSQLVTESEFTSKCLPLVERFMDDEDEHVRHELTRIFNHDRFFEFPWASEFLAKYVKSKSGIEDRDWVLWKLKNLAGSLVGFADVILAMCDITVHHLAHPDPSNQRYRDIDGLVSLMLRLYDDASGENLVTIQQKCLDAWDTLLQTRATVAWSLTRGLDAAPY